MQIGSFRSFAIHKLTPLSFTRLAEAPTAANDVDDKSMHMPLQIGPLQNL